MENAQVIDKVKKLLALATSTNEHEAAAAAAKAQELLLKYNLSTSVLEDDEKAPEATKLDVDVPNDTSTWVGVMYNGVAQAHGCCVVQTTYTRPDGGTGRRFFIFGRATNVEVVQYLGTYLYREIRRLSRPKGVKTVSRWRNAFRHGAVAIVVGRLNAGRAEFASTDDTRALVVVLDAEAETLKNKMFPKLTTTHARSVDAAGYSAGVRAGKDIALNRGVRSNAGGQLMLGGAR